MTLRKDDEKGINMLKRLNLHLFDESADGAEVAQPKNGAETEVTETQNQQITEAEKKPTFEELIAGDYKEDAQKYFDTAFAPRFRELKEKAKSKATEIEKKYQPLIETLSARYKGEKDPQKLLDLMYTDNALLEVEAMEKGIDIEALKNQRKFDYLQTQNQQLQEQIKNQEEIEQRQAFLVKLDENAEEFKQIIPDFNLDNEMQNEDFKRLIWALGGDVKAAYMALHHDDMLSGIAKNAFQKGKEKVAESIKNQKSRPLENGLSSGTAIQTQFDPSKLTREQRIELAERARRGENIPLDKNPFG